VNSYFSDDTLKQSAELTGKWEDEVRRAAGRIPDEKAGRSTVSDLEIKRLYTPEDIRGTDFARDIGAPGEFPFLRGNQATGYRGRTWTFRMFSGMGSAQDTNARWRMLLKQGQTGLSTAFDFPTLMGYDSDSPKARGECGRCGVAIDTLDDFLTLMEGIPLDRVTTSMTINPPATALWAMYCAAAEIKGAPLSKIGGTIQNDMLKEFIAQKTFMCPPEPSVRLISDTVEFGAKHVPNWNTISISGYHIREAGSTAIQELAFTLRDGIEYVEDVIRRKGLDVDEFAPRLFRGDLQDAGGPADLGAGDAREVPREEPPFPVDAFPHADGRLFAHRPAALQQRRPDGRRGARRRPRRNAVPPHELPGRGALPALRPRGRNRAAHPADFG
jgi:methylmalonyl-CoA mutase N-terminal domain/subunit